MSEEDRVLPQASAADGLLWITSCVVGAATPRRSADTAAAWTALESALALADDWDAHRDAGASPDDRPLVQRGRSRSAD